TLIVLLVIAFAALWAFALPRVLRALANRRTPPGPAGRIRASWERTARAFELIDLGPNVGETPIEHSRRVERMTGIDKRTLDQLARDATAAIYGEVGDDGTAHRCEQQSADIIGAIRSRLGPRERAISLFDPRRAAALSIH
ncbi:MAG: hypothetical protein JWL72_1405, partial [Ilumatobacteraceae bacterium]|nr:hypothetical protein [Ilumatobacteraceae bacterium]